MADNVTVNITQTPDLVTVNITECALTVSVDGVTITGDGSPGNPLVGVAGTGDMAKAVYDPTNINSSAFNMENMSEGATKKILTVAERTKLTNTSGVNTGDQDLSGYLTSATAATTYEPLKGTDDNYVTDAQLIVIGNTSGTNTGDQDLSGLVPYTGATGAVNLGEHSITTGHVQLDTTPTTPASAVGKIVWNDTDGTANIGLKGGNVTLQIGQEVVARVVNKTGVNLTQASYECVKVTGAQGQRIKVDLAQANNTLNTTDVLGLVTENINDNNEGFITAYGLVREIDTTGTLQGEVWADGDSLYLSPTTAGGLTKVKPASYIVSVGFVVHSHAVNGSIFVSVHSYAGLVPDTRTLTINGVSYDLSSNRSWTIDALPTQTGNAGKYLKTDGTTATWEVAGGADEDFTIIAAFKSFYNY